MLILAADCLKALADGGALQFRNNCTDHWHDCNGITGIPALTLACGTIIPNYLSGITASKEIRIKPE